MIYNFVESFYCAAVPVTEELIDAWAAAGGNAFELSGYAPADSNTRLTLSLRLINPDDKSEYYDLSSDTFVYRPEFTINEGNVAMTETGDGAHLVLWSALALASIAGLTAMRRRSI